MPSSLRNTASSSGNVLITEYRCVNTSSDIMKNVSPLKFCTVLLPSCVTLQYAVATIVAVI